MLRPTYPRLATISRATASRASLGSSLTRARLGPRAVPGTTSGAARFSRAKASASARSASRSARLAALRVLTSRTTVPGEALQGQALEHLGALLVAAPRHQVLVAGQPGAVGEVDVRQPVAEVVRPSTAPTSPRRPCATGRGSRAGSPGSAGPSRAGRPPTPGSAHATGTCSPRRRRRRSRRASGPGRARTRGRSRAATGTAGARPRSRHRAARRPPASAGASPTDRVLHTRWVTSRHGECTASTGTP